MEEDAPIPGADSTKAMLEKIALLLGELNSRAVSPIRVRSILQTPSVWWTRGCSRWTSERMPLLCYTRERVWQKRPLTVPALIHWSTLSPIWALYNRHLLSRKIYCEYGREVDRLMESSFPEQGTHFLAHTALCKYKICFGIRSSGNLC